MVGSQTAFPVSTKPLCLVSIAVAIGQPVGPAKQKSVSGRVSRTHRLSTTVRNCTRDEGGPFETGSQVQVSSHRKLLSSRAMVVLCQEGARAPCCTRDEGGPFGAPVGEGFKPP